MAPYPTGTYKAVRGVQSVSVNTRFNIEYLFELSQLRSYYQTETIPDIEVSVERHLEGDAPLYLSLTEGATGADLVGRSNQRANLALTIFDETKPLASGSGNAIAQATLSGLFTSQIQYSFPLQGAATESVTAVGNNKVWSTGTFTFAGFTAAHGVTDLDPAAAEGPNLRQHMVMSGCVWPTNLPGINASGVNVETASSGYSCHIGDVRVSCSLGREPMYEQGRRGPYHRYAQFPAEVTTSIDVINTRGDQVAATESGVLAGGVNVSAQRIYLLLQEGLVLDLGANNLCQSVSETGGGAGGRGDNSTLSFQFVNQSELTVKHPADPTVALRP